MAKNNNLKDYLTDLYEGIANKKPNASRNPQNFRKEIESIETGINTSDATATANDILLGKTAYVNDEKIEGTIETYDYSVDEGGSSQDLIEALCNDTLTSYSNSNLTKVKEGLFFKNYQLENIDLPNVTTCETNAFYKCKKLKNVNLPQALTLGNQAFRECTVLESIDLPNATELGGQAFTFTTNLKKVNIPKITTLNNSVFSSSGIEIIKVPKVKNIYNLAFQQSTYLTDIYLGYEGLVYLSAINAFSSVTAGIKIHVRPEYASQYTEATNWSSLIADGTIVIVGDYKEE